MTNNSKIVYPELSYQVQGAAFKVFQILGYGLRESYYQKALCSELEKAGLKYEKQKALSINYDGKKLGNIFLDLVIENKIVVELKIKHSLGYPHIRQVVDYLRAGNYKLGILLYFTSEGVKYRRVINPNYKE